MKKLILFFVLSVNILLVGCKEKSIDIPPGELTGVIYDPPFVEVIQEYEQNEGDEYIKLDFTNLSQLKNATLIVVGINQSFDEGDEIKIMGDWIYYSSTRNIYNQSTNIEYYYEDNKYIALKDSFDSQPGSTFEDFNNIIDQLNEDEYSLIEEDGLLMFKHEDNDGITTIKLGEKIEEDKYIILSIEFIDKITSEWINFNVKVFNLNSSEFSTPTGEPIEKIEYILKKLNIENYSLQYDDNELHIYTEDYRVEIELETFSDIYIYDISHEEEKLLMSTIFATEDEVWTMYNYDFDNVSDYLRSTNAIITKEELDLYIEVRYQYCESYGNFS